MTLSQTLFCFCLPIIQVQVEGRDLKLIESAQSHDNVTSCSGDSDMPNDDPCLKLPVCLPGLTAFNATVTRAGQVSNICICIIAVHCL